MLKQFEAHIRKWHWGKENTPLLIACSGGLDSVCLVHLCEALKLNFAIAHCNFNLRGVESDTDERFVRQLGESLRKKVFVKSFDTKIEADNLGGSIQMVARKLRYDWFEQLMTEQHFKVLLTAHHADDNLETFLINLSRGTGLAGLTGIPEKNGFIHRPLLPFSKGELKAFAKSRNLVWREDSSNEETKYLRNKVRHHVVPELYKLHPTFLSNFQSTLDYLKQSETILNQYKDQLQKALFEAEGGRIRIAIQKLKAYQPDEGWMYFLFSEFGFTEWGDVFRLLDGQSGKEVRSATHRLLKDRNHLLLSEIKENNEEEYLINEGTQRISSPLHLTWGRVEKMGLATKNVVYIDADKISFPLVLRKIREGDWFIPFGMQGKKKISKFLKDEKIDRFSKESIWLLCSGDTIVWVVGLRMDDRFKVHHSSKNILKIELS